MEQEKFKYVNTTSFNLKISPETSLQKSQKINHKRLIKYKELINTYLNKIKNILLNDRVQDYGNPKESFERIANYWSVFLNKKLTSKDVAIMMILFKVAREQHRHKEDNILDICGYALLSNFIKDTENESYK